MAEAVGITMTMVIAVVIAIVIGSIYTYFGIVALI